MWAGSPVSLGLALRPDPGRRASVCIVVMAVFLIICIINFFARYSRAIYFLLNFKICFTGMFLMMGDAAAAAVGSFACLPGSSIETGPGEPGERVYCCRVCVPHYLQHIFSTVFE